MNRQRRIATHLCSVYVLAALLLPCAAGQKEQARSEKKGEVKLFNGKDFSGWTYYLEDPNVKMEDVWSIDQKEGIIICKGQPAGYIRTVADYTNFILKFQWRYTPSAKEGDNSGVLLRLVGPDRIWPKMIEAQLQVGQAGDFWINGGAKLVTPRSKQGHLSEGSDQRIRFKSNEKPVGQWNQYEITFDRDKVILKINGEVVNEGTGAEEVPGKIALQSEGVEIHFRDIRLTPLGD